MAEQERTRENVSESRNRRISRRGSEEDKATRVFLSVPIQFSRRKVRLTEDTKKLKNFIKSNLFKF